jgi:hypothetical protein
MTNSSGSGGTSLAPTPTHPHHLSREPSREDIEMAQNLSLLNHSQDSNQPRMASAPKAQQSGDAPEGQSPEIYHSLEDTLAFQQSEQPEEAPTPATLASTSRTGAGGANAPLTGQVCRCVTGFSCHRHGSHDLPNYTYSRTLHANKTKQLWDDSDASVAPLANWRNNLQCLRFVSQSAESISANESEASPTSTNCACPRKPSTRPKP